MSTNDTRDGIVAWANQFATSEGPVENFAELADGVMFVDILSQLSADFFDPSELKRGIRGNTILCKSNVDKLIDALSTFVQEAHEGHGSFSLGETIDSSKVVDAANDPDALTDLAEFVFTICLTSGGADMIGKLRQMSKPQQQALQASAKRVMTTHTLKKASVPAARSSSNLSPVPGATSSPSASGVRVFGAASSDPTALLEENKKLNEQILQLQTQVNVNQAAHEELSQRYQQVEGKYKKLVDEQTVGQSTKAREWYDKLEAKSKAIHELEEELREAHQTIETITKDREQQRETRDVLQREISTLNEAVDEERKQKTEARNEVELAKDKNVSYIRHREEMETELEQALKERKTLEEKIAQKKDEVVDREDRLHEKEHQLETLQKELEETKEKLSELEAAESLASNFARRTDNFASPTETLREELKDLRLKADATEAEHEAALAEKDAALAELQEKLKAAELGSSSATETAAAEAMELKKDNESLKAHLQNAVSMTESLQKQVAELQERSPVTVTQQGGGADTEAVDHLTKENTQLKENMKTARSAARLEQAAIFSAFFECGHRSMQVQQRQLLGAPPIPTATLFEPPSDSGVPMSFLEKHRRVMEQHMLLNLAPQTTPSPRRH